VGPEDWPHPVDPGTLGEYAAVLDRGGRAAAAEAFPAVAAHLARGCAACEADLADLLEFLAAERQREGDAMSSEEHKAVARRLFEAMTRGDLGAVDELFTPDAVVHDQGRELRGREAIKRGLALLRAGFPDVVYTVEDQIAEGDEVASRYRGEGTHLGEWRGVPPTGRRFAYTGVLIHRFEGSQIAEFWGHSDSLGLLRQLGAVPSPPA
jgi:steroid delta-isomerase-like uncharacterized protein